MKASGRIEFATGLDRLSLQDAESIRLIELGDMGRHGTVRLLEGAWKDFVEQYVRSAVRTLVVEFCWVVRNREVDLRRDRGSSARMRLDTRDGLWQRLSPVCVRSTLHCTRLQRKSPALRTSAPRIKSGLRNPPTALPRDSPQPAWAKPLESKFERMGSKRPALGGVQTRSLWWGAG